MSLTPPLTPNQVVFMWISVALGTLLGLVFGLVAGPGKLIPGHPMNRAMAYGFENVYGPFMGCSGTGLRIFVGIGEVLSGVGILVGVWLYAFNVGGEQLCDLNAALQIVAGIGLMCVGLSSGAMHMYVDGTPDKYMPTYVLAIISMVFVAIRMFILGPYLFMNQVIATVFGSCMLCVMLTFILINNTNGKHESLVEKENKELAKIMNGGNE